MTQFFLQKSVQSKTAHSRAFTLVELMVSLSIFSIVMVISVGTLLTMIDINAKGQALSSAMTNLSFALDSMTREIRTGYHYQCYVTNDSNENQGLPAENEEGVDCEDGANSIVFVRERDGARLGYRLLETEDNSVIQQNLSDTNWQQITSEEVVIDGFEFKVTGSEPYYTGSVGSDKKQPAVDLFISGHIDNGLAEPTEFSMQTHIVGRRIDLF